MLWKILFLVVMELGIRNDLVDPDTGTPLEEGEEEDDPTHDPEVHPDEHDNNDESGGDGSDPGPIGGGPDEPDAEQNPRVSDVSKSDDAHGGHVGGGRAEGSNDSVKDGDAKWLDTCEASMDVSQAEDLAFGAEPLYDPFDRPRNEIIVQYRSRSRIAQGPVAQGGVFRCEKAYR